MKRPRTVYGRLRLLTLDGKYVVRMTMKGIEVGDRWSTNTMTFQDLLRLTANILPLGEPLVTTFPSKRCLAQGEPQASAAGKLPSKPSRRAGGGKARKGGRVLKTASE